MNLAFLANNFILVTSQQIISPAHSIYICSIMRLFPHTPKIYANTKTSISKYS